MNSPGNPDWNQRAGRWDNAARYLPEQRGRDAFSVTWREWWDRFYGPEAGMKLDEYCRANGIATGA